MQTAINEQINELLAIAPLTCLPIKTPSFLISQARAHLNNDNEFNEFIPTTLINPFDENQKVATTTKELSIPVQPAICINDNDIRQNQNAHNATAASDSPARLSPPNTQNNVDHLFSSPIFNYAPFDGVSLLDEPLSDASDDLVLNSEYRKGLTNINYDFDISDQSADNSISQDSKLNLSEFDPLIETSTCDDRANTDNGEDTASLIDAESLPNGTLLPPPLQPTSVTPEYKGFTKSAVTIASISCNTGDFSSLNSNNDENVLLQAIPKETK